MTNQIEFAYRGSMSVSYDEAEMPYLYNHVLTRAENGTPLYIKFGVAHRVVDVFASGDMLSYEIAPYQGAWDVRGEQAFDSEIDPVGYARWRAESDARYAELQAQISAMTSDWEEPEDGSMLAKLRGAQIVGLND